MISSEEMEQDLTAIERQIVQTQEQINRMQQALLGMRGVQAYLRGKKAEAARDNGPVTGCRAEEDLGGGESDLPG